MLCFITLLSCVFSSQEYLNEEYPPIEERGFEWLLMEFWDAAKEIESFKESLRNFQIKKCDCADHGTFQVNLSEVMIKNMWLNSINRIVEAKGRRVRLQPYVEGFTITSYEVLFPLLKSMNFNIPRFKVEIYTIISDIASLIEDKNYGYFLPSLNKKKVLKFKEKFRDFIEEYGDEFDEELWNLEVKY